MQCNDWVLEPNRLELLARANTQLAMKDHVSGLREESMTFARLARLLPAHLVEHLKTLRSLPDQELRALEVAELALPAPGPGPAERSMEQLRQEASDARSELQRERAERNAAQAAAEQLKQDNVSTKSALERAESEREVLLKTQLQLRELHEGERSKLSQQLGQQRHLSQGVPANQQSRPEQPSPTTKPGVSTSRGVPMDGPQPLQMLLCRCLGDRWLLELTADLPFLAIGSLRGWAADRISDLQRF